MSVAFDWNQLRRDRVINATVGGLPVVIALAGDSASFVAYARPDTASRFTLRSDSLIGAGRAYDFSGRSRDGNLRRVKASQEFWHSWRTFQPATRRHGGGVVD